MRRVSAIVTGVMLAVVATVGLMAHPMTYKGTVVSVTARNLRVHAMDDMTKKESIMTFTVSDKTKVLRGDTEVKFADARIQKDERIAVTVNTDDAPDAALVIRLAAQSDVAAPVPSARVEKAGPVTVAGCVARGAAGRYMLTGAAIAGSSDAKSYDLQGGAFKAHVGHKVAVTGTVVPPAMAGHQGMSQEAMDQMRATLRVKSVKMIAASCS